jgi:hypothetical protein
MLLELLVTCLVFVQLQSFFVSSYKRFLASMVTIARIGSLFGL